MHRYISEWTHQWLDYVTRTTGRLTKNVQFLDAGDFGWSDFSMKNVKAEGKAMGIMEDCYPQLLERVYICHPPGWLQKPWRVLRPILPHRVVDKVDFSSPRKNETERRRFSAFVAEQSLPARFGGQDGANL